MQKNPARRFFTVSRISAQIQWFSSPILIIPHIPYVPLPAGYGVAVAPAAGRRHCFVRKAQRETTRIRKCAAQDKYLSKTREILAPLRKDEYCAGYCVGSDLTWQSY